jgi:hypothetical protein
VKVAVASGGRGWGWGGGSAGGGCCQTAVKCSPGGRGLRLSLRAGARGYSANYRSAVANCLIDSTKSTLHPVSSTRSSGILDLAALNTSVWSLSSFVTHIARLATYVRVVFPVRDLICRYARFLPPTYLGGCAARCSAHTGGDPPHLFLICSCRYHAAHSRGSVLCSGGPTQLRGAPLVPLECVPLSSR